MTDIKWTKYLSKYAKIIILEITFLHYTTLGHPSSAYSSSSILEIKNEIKTAHPPNFDDGKTAGHIVQQVITDFESWGGLISHFILPKIVCFVYNL